MFLLRTLRQAPRLDPRRAERCGASDALTAQKPARINSPLSSSAVRKILGIPDAYQLGIVPASDTGAVEMALWSLLGERGVDVLAWESFSSGWAADCKNQLQLKDLRVLKADYGKLPDLDKVDWAHDVVFAWNGTTSGVRVPNGYLDRRGPAWSHHLRRHLGGLCDGDPLGQARRGHLVLAKGAGRRRRAWHDRAQSQSGSAPGILHPQSPVAEDLSDDQGASKLIAGIFQGETINTPSMLCVEDALDGLKWAESIGGLPALIARSKANLKCIEDWVAQSSWAAFLAEDKSARSSTSICLKIKDPLFASLSADQQNAHVKSIVSSLEKERVAYDIGAYRDAPVGLRIWGGATVETSDIQALLPWLDWAYGQARAAHAA